MSGYLPVYAIKGVTVGFRGDLTESSPMAQSCTTCATKARSAAEPPGSLLAQGLSGQCQALSAVVYDIL